MNKKWNAWITPNMAHGQGKFNILLRCLLYRGKFATIYPKMRKEGKGKTICYNRTKVIDKMVYHSASSCLMINIVIIAIYKD